MKLFTALHVWQPCAGLNVFFWDPDGIGTPECFRRAARSGKPFGHLFDRDRSRLVETVRSLGVSVIKVHVAHPPSGVNLENQHVDLCGRPLERAIAEAAVADEKTIKRWQGSLP